MIILITQRTSYSLIGLVVVFYRTFLFYTLTFDLREVVLPVGKFVLHDDQTFLILEKYFLKFTVSYN